jgi:hypothetical protein
MGQAKIARIPFFKSSNIYIAFIAQVLQQNVIVKKNTAPAKL